MKTLTSLDTPIPDEPFINAADGKVYVAVKSDNSCNGCVFYRKYGCDICPDCTAEFTIFKEHKC